MEMKLDDTILMLFTLVAAIGLFLLADFAVKVPSSRWRLLYAVPVVIGSFVIAYAGVEISMIGVYLGLVILLVGFVVEQAKVRKICSVLAVGGIVLSGIICSVNPMYRAVHYDKDFKEAIETFENRYVLLEHKNIDLDALYKKYLPMFEEAYREQDPVKNEIAWIKFCQEFHDGHTHYQGMDANVTKMAKDVMYGNDYGLSIMTLENGKNVAVNVEENSQAYLAGIKNGTVILSWDGKSVDERKVDVDVTDYVFSSIQNEQFFSALLVAGMGNDTVSVTFLDEADTEQTVTLEKMGAYTDRLEKTIAIIDEGYKLPNLAWAEIDDDTVLLRVRQMSYDSEADQNDDYGRMKQEIGDALSQYKAEGKTNLILDLRCNSGGTSGYVKVFGELLAPLGEQVYAYEGVYNKETKSYEKVENQKDTYVVGEKVTYVGEDLWHDGKIILLVNDQTVSAGDHFTKLAEDYPNVTILGFTSTYNAAQGLNPIVFSHGYLSFSAVLVLDEEGKVNIDTDAERESTISLDVRIPFDETAVNALFNEGSDYILQKAMEVLYEN